MANKHSCGPHFAESNRFGALSLSILFHSGECHSSFHLFGSHAAVRALREAVAIDIVREAIKKGGKLNLTLLL